MHETMVKVLELSSIIEKEKSSSENYLNSNKKFVTYRFSLIIVENSRYNWNNCLFLLKMLLLNHGFHLLCGENSVKLLLF